VHQRPAPGRARRRGGGRGRRDGRPVVVAREGPPAGRRRPDPLVRASSVTLPDGQVVSGYEVDGTGPTLVLVAGWKRSAAYWKDLLQTLGEHGQRAVALNVPGLGAPARPWPLFLQAVGTIDAVLHARWRDNPDEQVVLAGASMGSCVTAAYVPT